MDRSLQQELRTRARYRCEYCLFPEAFARLPFHVDHIIAQQHGGPTDIENLALACSFCNRYKGPNIAAIDPASGELVALFNPRRQAWGEHFAWSGSQLIAHTSIGRATIHLLQIDRPNAVAVRGLLIEEGLFETGTTGLLMVHEPPRAVSLLLNSGLRKHSPRLLKARFGYIFSNRKILLQFF